MDESESTYVIAIGYSPQQLANKVNSFSKKGFTPIPPHSTVSLEDGAVIEYTMSMVYTGDK